MNGTGLNMLESALTLEEKGFTHYQKALDGIKNPLGHDMIESLMRDEQVHMERIRMMAQKLKDAGAWSTGWKTLHIDEKTITDIFQRMTKDRPQAFNVDTTDIEALDFALGLERESILFYENALNQSKDPNEREFLTQIIREENKHRSSLEDVKLYLTDPTGWFSEHEHHSLDGA